MNKKQNSIFDIDKLKYETYDKLKQVKLIFEESIPNHWNVKKVKNNVVKPITDGPHITPKLVEKGIPFLSVNNIQNNQIIFDNKIRYVSENDAKEYRKKTDIKRNDLLLVKQASIGKLSLVETDEILSIWSPLVQFRFKDYIIPKYMKYYMESELYQNNLDLTASESTQKNISMGDIQNLYDILPLKKEQLAIVKFLDSKTSQIDKKIELLENQNRLEEELEKSIINQCVTKGVDSFIKKDKNGNLIDFDNTLGLSKKDFDVYMNENGYKDSGIDWIGYVSKCFKISRLKDEIKLFHGYSFKDSDTKDGTNKYLLKITQINNDIIDLTKSLTINENNFEKFKVNKNDLLIALSGATAGKIGLNTTDENIYLNQRVAKIISNKYITKYLFYYFKLDSLINQMFLSSNSSAQPNFNNSILELYNIKLSKKEQLEIVKFLDSKTSQIKVSIKTRSKEIKLLKEYKKTLINDVVTGKIKVIKD